MSQTLDSHALQEKLVKNVLSTFMTFLDVDSISLPKNNDKDDDKNFSERTFAKVLCCSCVGDIKTLFESFKETTQIQNISQQQKPFESENLVLEELEDILKKINEDLIDSENNSKRNKYLYFLVTIYLQQVNEEFERLNKDPSFKEVHQLESKTKKKFDKTERVNQLIIHDLLYLIDKLNRQISMKKT
ncbi:hypothetical protein M9Y10_027633 [Tritrichomonas musculus]|uniref:Uncharacterized protein n=1 Tax=Tritrichomonas musculus TaxID=1915356 RepID=A0ABR2H3S0_9EUKA